MTIHSTITYLPKDSGYQLSLEPLVREAITAAVARQKALGLPNYYINKKGKIYARLPNGRFTSIKR